MYYWYEALFFTIYKAITLSEKNLSCFHRAKFWQGENTLAVWFPNSIPLFYFSPIPFVI